MDTRSTKKRHSTAPNTSAKRYLGLEFGTVSPSPKRRKTETSPVEKESFTSKSFYGAREKKSFPHSPGRRKAAHKILDKLSDENTDSDSDGKGYKSSRFDFHSTSTSDSADTDGEMSRKRPLRESNSLRKSLTKKKPLKIIKKSKTPKGNKQQKFSSMSTGKIHIQRDKELCKDNEATPIISGKKFFKTRSPGSSFLSSGGVVARKGFDLKFVARKLKVTQTPTRAKENNKTLTSSSTKVVSKASASKASEFKAGNLFMSDGEASCGEPDKSLTNTNKIPDSGNQTPEVYYATPVNLADIQKDSAIDTANSSDLFSSCQPVDDKIASKNDQIEQQAIDTSQSNDVDSISLISGSEDLFSDAAFESGRNTPSLQSQISSSVASPARSLGSESPSSVVSGSTKNLFPIFTKQLSKSPSSQIDKLRSSGSNSPRMSPLLRSTKRKDKMEQMVIDAGQKFGVMQCEGCGMVNRIADPDIETCLSIYIDAGQKKFGVTQCEGCGMVYNIADPDDETTHYNHHQNTMAALKFPGWKKENVVQKYPLDGSRVLKVTSDSPKYALKKIEEINYIMGQELGTTDNTFHFRPTYQAFLYISDKKRVEGCVIAEPLDHGYPVMPESDSSQGSQNHPGNRPWYCSDTPQPASVGISRIWVHNQSRRKGVGTKLLDCVRQWFVYGSVISKRKIAFSDPTQNGKTLAMKYTGNPKFLVYKFNK